MLVVKDLESWLSEEGCGQFGSLCGIDGLIGIYATLKRVEDFYNTVALGANAHAESASAYLQARYDAEETDSSLAPALLSEAAQLRDGDVGKGAIGEA